MPTKDERIQAIDDLERDFLSYVRSKKEQLEADRDFLQNVLEGRTGGMQELQLKNVEEAAIFAAHEINYFLGV